jgi:hypothetical protein
MPGKRVQFDEETWEAIDLLARDRMMDFQELADEAFRDLLRKYDRPTDLAGALRRSLDKAKASSSGARKPDAVSGVPQRRPQRRTKARR